MSLKMRRIIAADRTLLDLSKPETVVATVREIAPDLIINPAVAAVGQSRI
jgi:dTDP-4-dehydrorhamnose reductase